MTSPIDRPDEAAATFMIFVHLKITAGTSLSGYYAGRSVDGDILIDCTVTTNTRHFLTHYNARLIANRLLHCRPDIAFYEIHNGQGINTSDKVRKKILLDKITPQGPKRRSY